MDPKHKTHATPARSSMFTAASKAPPPIQQQQQQPPTHVAASQQQPHPGVTTAPTGASANSVGGGGGGGEGSWKKLKGRYLTFFAAEAHRDVELWYSTVADKQQRAELKHLVHAILALDFAVERKKRLRHVAVDPDITGANALLNANGAKYFSAEAKLKAVEFLSLASVTDKNAFRNVFGRMTAPSLFTATRSYGQDYDPTKKFWKPQNMLGACKELLGKSHMQRPSFPIEAPGEVAEFASKTSHGQSFVWKLPRKSPLVAPASANAEEQSATGGGGSSAGHGAKVASSCQAAPWGSLDVGNIDGTQWRSVTNEQFDHAVFMSNPATRHFQNYNENYCRLLSSAVMLARSSNGGCKGAKTALRASSTLPEIPRPAVQPVDNTRPASCLP